MEIGKLSPINKDDLKVGDVVGVAREVRCGWGELFRHMVKITQCQGKGQGTCKRCNDKGIWNREWMCFLYRIEGLEGCYCRECVKEIMREEEKS